MHCMYGTSNIKKEDQILNLIKNEKCLHTSKTNVTNEQQTFYVESFHSSVLKQYFPVFSLGCRRYTAHTSAISQK